MKLGHADNVLQPKGLTMFNLHRYFAPLLAATILALPTISIASFQTTISGSVHGLNPTMDVQLPGCSYQYVNTSATGHCDFTDSTPGFSVTRGDSFGQIDAFGLHAFADEIVSISFPAGYRIAVDSSTEVSFVDFIRVTGAAPTSGYVSLTLDTHGVVGLGGTAESFLGIDRTSCHVNFAGHCTVRQLVDFSSFEIYGDLLVGAHAVVGGENGVCCVYGSSTSSSSDFRNTATITDIAFYDIAGNRLALNYVTDSGFLYNATAPVPEPPPWVLLTTAIAAVGAFSKRRKSVRRVST